MTGKREVCTGIYHVSFCQFIEISSEVDCVVANGGQGRTTCAQYGRGLEIEQAIAKHNTTAPEEISGGYSRVGPSIIMLKPRTRTLLENGNAHKTKTLVHIPSNLQIPINDNQLSF